jgi:prolipoprotein diacylglyceryltransferase
LLLIDRVTDLRPGRLFVVYLVGYFFGRFMIEGLRIDPAHSALGWRLNQWVALAVVVAGLGFLVADWWRHRSESVPTEPDANSSAPDAQSSVRPTA